MPPAVRHPRTPQSLGFADFELDLRVRELRRSGARVRLQEQPFNVLALLVERADEVVTREEIRQHLWPSDTFVDFDNSLNTAINKIREAIGDSAESPRFIETLPRRGYRFIGTVDSAVQTSVIETGRIRSVGRVAKLTAFGVLGVVAAGAVLVGLNVGRWRDRLFAQHTNPRIRALAVLPLTNLSGDPEQEYFADGMTEALITELGKISTPRVISRQSIMQYKGSNKPLQQIARELSVDAVLEGAVERSGDRVRVTVHLEQASPESQLWANEYSRSIRDVLGLQDEIARAVTDEIQIKLTLQERARMASSRPVDPEAHDDYLRGRYQYNQLVAHQASRSVDLVAHEDYVQLAIGYFKQAIEKDPAYALAYAGLADAYIALGHPSWGVNPPKETLPQAKAAVTKALELDPSLGEAHFSLAQIIELYDWN